MTTTETRWDEKEVMKRAFRAYFRAAHREGALDCQIMQPGNYSHVQEHRGRFYAVLRSGRKVLGIWRVDAEGGLHGLPVDGRLARVLEED